MGRARTVNVIRAVAFAGLALIASSTDAHAQSSGFLTRADYTLLFAGIASPDPRFASQAQVRLDADLADWGAGRLTFTADYEAFIGTERRQWDLNQGAYRFSLAASHRIGAAEIAGTFLHVSRHLVDRENPPSIAWNAIGVRATDRWNLNGGATIVGARIDFARDIEQAVVDYVWTTDARVAVRHTPASWHRASLLADVSASQIRTKHEMYGRPKLCGARLEGGFRVNGQRAAVEVFLGYERRIDGFPTDRFRVRMWTFGFRLVSK